LSYYSKWHGTPEELKTRLDEVVKNHSIKIAIAEYADNHRKVNDIVYNLPDEKGIGTFCWEPQEYMEAMFDWKNSRRETNSTIDLYPVMSKDFGNDAITGVVEQGNHDASDMQNGKNHLESIVNASEDRALLDLQGRVVGNVGKLHNDNPVVVNKVYLELYNRSNQNGKVRIILK
jgi:arabinogalactan endo-1,4-beta-galactosidase